jgi:uncharacterized membrane protein
MTSSRTTATQGPAAAAVDEGEAVPAVGHRSLPWLLLVGGLVGFLASFDLVVERIKLLIDPSYQPSCSINPLLSCGSVMQTDQASLFGFSNPILGVAAFPVVAAVGTALLAGARFRPWFWWGLVAGEVLGAVFVHWLAFESVFRIGALCPYCMVVWAVTLPILLYTFLHAGATGHLGLGSRARSRVSALADYHLALLVGWYGLFVVVIALKFWDQWMAMLGL